MTVTPGYATTKQRELAAAIRRDRRGGAHLVVLARTFALPIDVITRVVQARSVEGAAKALVAFCASSAGKND